MNKKKTSAVTNGKPIRDPSKPKSEGVELQELRPGQSVELLKELHILTRDGRLNQDSRRKLKQVYHLFNFIEPLLTELSIDSARIIREPRSRSLVKLFDKLRVNDIVSQE